MLALYIYKRKATSTLHSKLIVGGKQATMFTVVYVLFSNETSYVHFASIHCPGGDPSVRMLLWLESLTVFSALLAKSTRCCSVTN